MCQVANEKLQEVVVGEFVSDRGSIRGAFATVDDAFVLVNTNIFERLLNEVPIFQEMSYAEIKAKYGERIINDSLEEQNTRHIEELRQKRYDSGKKSGTVRKDYANADRRTIIRAIVLGQTAGEIIKEYGFSRTKVYKVLSSFTEDEINDLWFRSPEYFEGISREQVQDLIDSGFKFSKLYKIRAEKAEAAAKKQAEISAEAEAFWKGVEERYQAYLAEDTATEPVQIKGTDVVTMDNLPLVLGVSVEAPAKKVKEPTEEGVVIKVNSKKAISDRSEEYLVASALAKRKPKVRVRSEILEKMGMSADKPAEE